MNTKRAFGPKRLYVLYGLGMGSLIATALVGCKTGDLVSGGTGLPGPGQIIFNDPSPVPSNNNPAGATYVGVEVCASCHGRAVAGHPNGIYQEWLDTPHGNDLLTIAGGSFFTRTIADGNWPSSSGLNGCDRCHVTGARDAGQPQGADDGGYDTSKPYNDFHNQKLWSMQCEGCHGPGSAHVAAGGAPNKINRVQDSKATCWKCHVHQPNEKGNPPVPAIDTWLAAAPYQFDPTKSNSLGRSHAAGVMAAGPGSGAHEYAGKTYSHSPHYQIANSCQTCHGLRLYNEPTKTHDTNPRKEACAFCHGGAMSAADVEHVIVNPEGEDVEELKAEITALLIQLGGGTTSPDRNGNAVGGALRAYLDGGGTSVDLKYRRARWNYQIILNDQSAGIHDYEYAKQLIEDAIYDLTH